LASRINPQIDIHVETRFLPEQSDASAQQYAFAYVITITNQGPGTYQLLNRHWVITDATGQVEEVRGAGVVGEQPTLQPGQAFRYSSGSMLKTPVGAMQGEYEFVDDAGSTFLVDIEPFSLSQPNLVH